MRSEGATYDEEVATCHENAYALTSHLRRVDAIPRQYYTSAMSTLPTSWIVQTKLRPPLVRAETIPRARLLEQLHRAIERHPLTLVSAPAGSGKTMLLASWIASLHAAPLAHSDVVWLALDPHDDDPALFLAALLAALQRVLPGCGEQVQATLTSGVDPRVDLIALIGLLLNELDTQLNRLCIVVLDDLHTLADPQIYRALEYLVERMPPQLRLVLATRHDPPLGLARLRVRRLLAELRLAELRFTAEETERLLAAMLGAALDAEQVRAIWLRTEGWAAGISLLAGSLERLSAPAERERLLAGLAHTDRAILEYLAEEVIERQDPFVRMFLLETAILSELTPAACAAVTGRSDAAALLDQLYRRNLFLMALDTPDAAAAYRYHDLFAEVLRERLRREHPGWLRDLHMRAARYATTPRHHVQHLLAAGQAEAAASMVESIGRDLIRRAAIPTLRQIIEALPTETLANRPQLMAFYGIALSEQWNQTAARPWLERAARAFATSEDQAQYHEILIYLADNTRMLGEYETSGRLNAELRAATLPSAMVARRLISDIWNALADGDAATGAADLAELIVQLEAHGDSSVLYPVATAFHTPFLFLPHGVALAERFCRVLAAAADQQSGPLQAAHGSISTWCALLRGRVDEAEVQVATVLALADRLGGLPWIDIDLALLPWAMHGLRGDLATAQRDAAAFLQHLDTTGHSAAQQWRTLYLALLARLAWLHSDTQCFTVTLALLRAAVSPIEWPSAHGLRIMIEGLDAMHRGDDSAEQLLHTAIAQQARYRDARLVGDARVALATLYVRRGQAAAALATFTPLLAECAHEQLPGRLWFEGQAVVVPLLQRAVAANHHAAFAERTLALFERDPAAATAALGVPDLAEPLTAREIEVLHLLAAGAGNQQIADTLIISLHTVKRHVTNILQKLDATSRLAAVARARSIGLLA